MTPTEPDRVQREIEELLGKLDNFVPEERLVSKIKNKRRQEAGPGLFSRTASGVQRRCSKVTLGHVMLLGLALLLLGQFAPGLFGGFAREAVIIGLVMTIIAFILSAMGWDSRRTLARGGTYEKKWRGQTITYSEPTRPNRIREWFRRGRK